MIVCNLPVVVTAYLRKYGDAGSGEEDSEPGTHQSTFGWRVASRSRKSGAGGDSQQSDTAMDVTTVNLRDFSTNTHLSLGLGVGERAVPCLSVDAARGQGQGDSFGGAEDEDDAVKQTEKEAEKEERPTQQGRQQRSIVWFAPDTFQRSESKDDEKA